ncbi:MAG: hypothetical protein M3131_00165 [Actinomycetota bacterium]|nr:hypothetical protein [Actinomycetota bacterium]
MGFLDKAKQMAEQSKRDMEERFKQTKGGGEAEGDPSGPGAGAVDFDDKGRPQPNETAQVQADAGIPVGESMQAEPGTIPPGQASSDPNRSHEPVEGERPEGFEHPGEGQPPAGRVERSGAAGNAQENRGSSPVEADDIHTSPETKK